MNEHPVCIIKNKNHNYFLTMPYSKSRARNLMDSSLSSKHCIIKSLCDCTVFGCVFRILDMASNPKYFTVKFKHVM